MSIPTAALLDHLATLLLSGEQIAGEIAGRLRSAIRPQWRGFEPLAQRYLEAFQGKTRPTRRQVRQFLRQDEPLQLALAKDLKDASIRRWLARSARMEPVSAAADWQVPAILSMEELACRFSLSPEELAWFADLKDLNSKHRLPALSHYRYQFRSKRSGGLRLIEAPKQHLKQLQRRILAEILEAIPAHPAAHGFLKGRSIRSYVAPHTGRQMLLRMDIQDFFPSIPAGRVAAFFRTAGYPETVAAALAGVCTNSAPHGIWHPGGVARSAAICALYGRPHLPQGAPTSPVLANLCAYRMDCRLEGLARSAGATYTRYADDLAFSGEEDFGRHASRFADHVAAVLLEEGFRIHYRKTRLMRPGVRQSLAGMVLNHHANIPREDYDRLKAILTNCLRYGPASQNREEHRDFRAHLCGCVAFVESVHPARGRRLRSIWDRIAW